MAMHNVFSNHLRKVFKESIKYTYMQTDTPTDIPALRQHVYM